MKDAFGNITSLAIGEKVGSKIRISGFVKNIPDGFDLWIVHRRVKGGQFWPKEPMITVSNNTTFSLSTFEGGAPGSINIALLMVKKSVSTMFNRWLIDGHKTNNYPGIAPNIKDICELDSIDVIYDKSRPLSLFYSYSHKDESFRIALEEHLSTLKREGYISSWSDRCITAGSDFSEKIVKEIENSDIILLLISSSFIASNYCYNIELRKALKRHSLGEARVIPVIVRPSDWTTMEFSNLLALPMDGKPITTWENQDEAWVDVVKGIRNVVEELR